MSCDSDTQENADVFDNTRNLDERYTYMNVSELLSTADRLKYNHWKCRTVGILKSVNGHFYLNDVSSKNAGIGCNLSKINEESSLQAPKLLVSMLYQDDIPNSVLPMTVQLFGIMQWIEKPVLLVEIIHVINPRMAVKLSNSLRTIINFQTNNEPSFKR